MAAALGISGFIIPVSNGDNVFKGHSIKPIHGGQPALCGISSAYLAKAGYKSGPLEGEPPRYHAPLFILGEPNPRPGGGGTRHRQALAQSGSGLQAVPGGPLQYRTR